MLKQLADEHHTYEVRQHFASLKWHVPCYMRENAGSWVSRLGSELLRSRVGGIPRGHPLDEAGSTFSRPKQRGNWVIPVTVQYKRLTQVFTIRPC